METKPSPFEKAMTHDFGTPFADLTIPGKWMFIGKLIACICTFGFAFPNVQNS